MTDYTAKVNAGIALLDSEKPGWRDKIDLGTLDLGSCAVCILGQVFGEYETGIDELDINGYDYGFNGDNYRELTAAWKEALGKNNALVEKGDVYKDKYGSAVKVLQTHLVRLDDDTVISTYVVSSGQIKSGKFETYGGTMSLNVLQKSEFESGGAYPIKVAQLKLEAGMFITANGKNYFVHNSNEVRELKDGAYATNAAYVDLEDAREMFTGMGVKFSQSVKNSI